MNAIIQRALAILLAVDFATAGWKTYLGLAVAAAGLVGLALQKLDATTAELLIALGIGFAGLGKLAADKRSKALQHFLANFAVSAPPIPYDLEEAKRAAAAYDATLADADASEPDPPSAT